MKTNLIRAAALTVVLGSVALAQTPPPERTTTGSAKPAAKMTPEEMKMADAKFLKVAYSGNMLEIKLSQYALEQEKEHADVRELAQMLVTHHEMGLKMVEEAAKKCGVELSKELLPAHKAKLDMAMECKGEMYHAPYLFCLASSHVEGILCVSHKMKTTEDAAIKEYCSQMLPKLKMHFAKIKPMAEMEAGVTDMMK